MPVLILKALTSRLGIAGIGILACLALWGWMHVALLSSEKATAEARQALSDQVAQDARAREDAVRKALSAQQAADKITHDADVAAAKARIVIRTITKTVEKEVPVYVTAKTDMAYPVPLGLVRALDAARLGVSGDQLSLPAGKSNDDPCPIAASTLASAGVACIRQNVELRSDFAQLIQWAYDQAAQSHTDLSQPERETPGANMR